MGAGIKSIAAAGIVGGIIWAFQRNMSDRQKQGLQPAKLIRTTTTTGGGTQDFTEQLFGALLGGAGDIVTGVKQAAGSVGFASVRSVGGPQPLLDMIAKYEGGVNGYDVVYGRSKIKTPKPLTKMTVAEVEKWQNKSVSAGSKSSAVGKYQIVRETLAAIIASGAINRGELFDKDCQERAGRHLLDGRGYQRFKAGTMPLHAFAKELAKEWASLPVLYDMKGHSRNVKAGESYYAGDSLNSAHYSPAELIGALKAVA